MTTLMNRKTTPDNPESTTSHSQTLSRNDIFKRIEEDRERHKRLRERRWVQPVAHNPSTYLPPQLASLMPLTDDGDGEEELTIDIEFENEWETTSDWNEDDDDAVRDENELCFAGPSVGAEDADGERPMDLS
jgi:CTD kinase subunit gamma